MKDFIKIKGSRIYYELAGEGEVIVLIHADSLDSRMWDKQFAFFTKKYKVLRYDIRGFGKSDIPSTEMYSFSEDLHLLLTHVSIEKAHVVGLSLGGAIAIDFALLYPDNVVSLVLADSGIAGHGFSPEFLKEVHEVIVLAKEHKLAEAKSKWLRLEFFAYSKQFPDVWNDIQTMVTDTSGYRWYGNNQPIDLQPFAANRLDEIHIPTRIIIGEHDIADFQKKASFMHQNIKRSKVVQIPHAGHLSNMDNPDQFNTELQTFLENLS